MAGLCLSFISKYGYQIYQKTKQNERKKEAEWDTQLNLNFRLNLLLFFKWSFSYSNIIQILHGHTYIKMVCCLSEINIW